MKRILVVQPIRPEGLKLFEARPDIEYQVLTDVSAENLIRNIPDADALTVRDAKLPAEVLQKAPKLKVIARHGVGFDNIPMDYCTARKLPVAGVGDVNAVSVAEHTLYLLFAVAKNGVQFDHAIRNGDFGIRSRATGIELRGKTVLVVGFGRVGQEVAKRARALGMEVIAYDPLVNPAAHEGVSFVDSLLHGLERAHIVTLHVPLTSETRGLVAARELGAMRKRSILINAARGGIVVENDLMSALDSGHLMGAGIDTFETEPLPAGHPLTLRYNVVLSPHSASLTEDCLIAMGVVTARNALDGLDGCLNPALVFNRAVLDA